MGKILITTSSFAQLDSAPRLLLDSSEYEIIENPHKRRLTEDEVSELLSKDVVGLIAGLEPLNRKVLSKSNLKVISRVGAGLSNIDLEAADELGIRVRSTPYGPTTAVAEMTLGMLLSLLRGVPKMDRALHEGRWEKMIGFQLEGKSVGIVGFGRIGQKFASLLEPFGVRIFIIDPLMESEKMQYPVVSLDSVLSSVDVLSFHISGDECLIERDHFSKMKPGVILLNAARGGVVNESALEEALEKDIVGGAWVDTFEQEPYVGPLSKYHNVILTPHIGSYTLEGRRNMETEAVNNLLSALSGST